MSDVLLARLLGKLPPPTNPPPLDVPAARETHLAERLDYLLAEHQFAFSNRPTVRMCKGLGAHRLRLEDGTLYVDRRALRSGQFSERVRTFDVPLHVLTLPLAGRFTEDPVAAYLASVGHLLGDAGPLQLAPWLPRRDAASLAAAPPDAETIVRAAAEAWGVTEAAGDALVALEALRSALAELRKRPYERAWLPALPVSPEALRMHGMPPVAVEWLRDRYGWREGVERLLPLQVLGVARGVTGKLLGQHGLIAAPTSAGKTLLAEARMLTRYFHPKGRRKTVFLVPTREAGREKYDQFLGAYGIGPRTSNPEARMRVCYADGDFHADDGDIGEGRFDVAIIVNEKFRFFQHSRQFLKGVGEVVFDELELIADPSRGVTLELALTSALTAHPEMTVLGLTRQAPGLHALRDALAVETETFLLETSQRPIPIQVGLYADGRVTYRDCNTGRQGTETLDLGYPHPKTTIRGLVMRFVQQTASERQAGVANNLVIATPTKRENLQLAYLLEQMAQDDEEVRSVLAANSRPEFATQRLPGLEPTQRREALERLLPLGIAVHDADLTVDERRLVTDAFRAGEVCVLFTTQTLAFGVNLPAHTIVFMDWGTSPGRYDSDLPPYYTKLGAIWDTWLGRVGRFGTTAHRSAFALYLSRGPRGSAEYETLRTLIAAEPPMLVTHLERAESFEAPVLYAIRSLYYAFGQYPTWPTLEAFFRFAPSTRRSSSSIVGQALGALRRLGGFEFPEAYRSLFLALERDRETGDEPIGALAHALAEALPPQSASEVRNAAAVYARDPEPLREVVSEPSTAAACLVAPTGAEGDDEDPDAPIRTRYGVERDTSGRFRLTRLGQIACAHGVSLATCARFRDWLLAHEGDPKLWDIADLIVLTWDTPDGRGLGHVRVANAGRREIGDMFDAYVRARARTLGDDWFDRRLVRTEAAKSVRAKATLLALAAWRVGVPLNDPVAGDDIETRFYLRSDGSSLYRHGKGHSRLLRVLADVARGLPQDSFPVVEPEATRPKGGLLVPYDLEEVAASLRYGMPSDRADLARLGIEGLSRTWVLRLAEAVDAHAYDPDLPMLDRVRRFAEEDAFGAAFPTPGLAVRVKRGVEDRPREALGEPLRQRPELAQSYYAHPFVAGEMVRQGVGRYTAMRVGHRKVYAVFRRNVRKGEPIVLTAPEDVAHWVQRGAVEFLAEIGAKRGDACVVDRFFLDLDPHNDYPLADLKRVAAELYARFARHRWTDPDRMSLHWTGGRGFHIVGVFGGDAWRPVETVKLEVMRVARPLANDVSIFLEDQPSIIDPHVVLDVSPIRARGVYRNLWSLHANTGHVCIPVDPTEIGVFDPASAAVDRVVARFEAPPGGGS